MAAQPRVGRIVHYTPYSTPGRKHTPHTPQCRAAIVASVYSPTNPHPDPEAVTGVEGSEWVALAVLTPTGLSFHDSCHDESTKASGTWHWPERT